LKIFSSVCWMSWIFMSKTGYYLILNFFLFLQSTWQIFYDFRLCALLQKIYCFISFYVHFFYMKILNPYKMYLIQCMRWRSKLIFLPDNYITGCIERSTFSIDSKYHLFHLLNSYIYLDLFLFFLSSSIYLSVHAI
jgi:hypothetical protein